jgi:signal transduction histidine kinase
MNRFLPGDPSEVELGQEGPPRSAPAAVHALLSNSDSGPQSLEDWLGDIAKVLGGRHAALVALLDHEAVVQYFSPSDSEFLATLNWPWRQQLPSEHEFRSAFAALATVSADGRSSFLTAAVQHEGILWVICLEDERQRTWTVDEQAALTMAALGLFHFASIQEKSQKWARWSERVEIQQGLEQAAVLVGRLVHDFNNVLTSILGFTELSLAQLPPGSAHRNFMSEVYAGAQQGSQLLSRLGQFTVRKMVPQGLITALNPLLAEAENRLRKAWGDAITLEVLIPPDLPALAIDADSLRVLLDKLLENAREAISTTGKVSLSARQVELTREDCLGLLGRACPGSHVEITVADSGRGFSAEARRRVFAEPFFSTKPRHRGLGLATVYGLMNNYGGGIRLEHGLHSGTMVHAYLPKARRAAETLSLGTPSSGRPCRPEGEHTEGGSAAINPIPFLGKRVG